MKRTVEQLERLASCAGSLDGGSDFGAQRRAVNTAGVCGSSTRGHRETIFAWTSAEYELYVAFGPLASKPVAVAAAHRLLRWLKKEQPSLFLLHPKQVTT